MTRRLPHYFFGVLVVAMGLMELPATAKPIVLGPSNPGAEVGSWYLGTNGGGYVSIDDIDPATGAKDFTLGNTIAGQENYAEWRSPFFPLGPAEAGGSPMIFSFSYKLLEKLKVGENIRVQLCFFNKTTNYVGHREFLLGSSSGDSEMTSYKKMAIGGIQAPAKAVMAAVICNANRFDTEFWTSGTGRFDDFSVITVSRFPLLKVVVPVTALLIIVGLTALYIRSRSQKE